MRQYIRGQKSSNRVLAVSIKVVYVPNSVLNKGVFNVSHSTIYLVQFHRFKRLADETGTVNARVRCAKLLL